jgi:hypothetical protein
MAELKSAETKKPKHKKYTETYPHFIISTKEKGKPKKIISHRHPEELKLDMMIKQQNGKIMKFTASAKREPEITVQKQKLELNWTLFNISSNLWYAVSKKNPKDGFFYISGNKKSVRLRKYDLRHVPNRVLAVLKAIKGMETTSTSTTSIEYKSTHRYGDREK